MCSSACIRYATIVFALSLIPRAADAFTPRVVQGNNDSMMRRRNQITNMGNLPRVSTTQLAAIERREVFGLARQVVGVLAASLFTFSRSAKASTIVNDNSAVNGRIITFTVNNLGGEEGKTGTFKIQVRYFVYDFPCIDWF
jgi:hypothetical protein